MGYDYTTKKPLEDFLLHVGSDDTESIPLVSTLPVASILGKQHYVSAVFHDLASDLVHVFIGMKFYVFEASEFKVSRNLIRKH